MILSTHAARACPCGAGLDLPLSPASGGGRARLVATRAPVYEAEVVDDASLDLLDPPDAALADVRCPSCGALGRATHVVCACDGRPLGADTLAGMDRHGRDEIARGERN